MGNKFKELDLNGNVLRAVMAYNEHGLAFRKLGPQTWYGFLSDGHAVLLESTERKQIQELLEQDLIEPMGNDFPGDYRARNELIEFCKNNF